MLKTAMALGVFPGPSTTLPRFGGPAAGSSGVRSCRARRRLSLVFAGPWLYKRSQSCDPLERWRPPTRPENSSPPCLFATVESRRPKAPKGFAVGSFTPKSAGPQTPGPSLQREALSMYANQTVYALPGVNCFALSFARTPLVSAQRVALPWTAAPDSGTRASLSQSSSASALVG